MKNINVAIVGAGLAGSVVANRLLNANFSVTVFEKSRGTGGRLSSCRLGEQSADLGAPYFHSTDAAFTQWLTQYPSVEPWQPKTNDFQSNPLQPTSYYVVSPRQSALTRSLLEGAVFKPSCRVGYLWPEQEAGKEQVILRDEQGQALGHYDAVIVTAPAPQSEILLEAVPRFVKRAQSVATHMNWVAVLQVAKTSVNVDMLTGEHPLLARCIKDSAKPGRNTQDESEIWFIEANQHWSNDNKHMDQAQVLEALKSTFFDVIQGQPEVISERCHRWLYSRHSETHKSTSDFLWDANLGIGAAGDWLSQGQSDLAGAWNSANRLADQIITDLHHLTV